MFIPLPYKIIAGVALIAAAFFYGYTKGSSSAEAQLQRVSADMSKQIADLEKQNSEISNNVVTEYVDRVNTIREREYVYLDAVENDVPSQFVMSNGWVYTHDISATSSDADSTRSSDASPSGVTDTQALAGVIRNYTICESNAVQLEELQRWIRENQAAVNASQEKNN